MIFGKRSSSFSNLESKPKKLKEDEEVKFTNKSGVTFTVNIVSQQMAKRQCPICSEKTITLNPVCIHNRHHVVCQNCAPKIVLSEGSRCPECNVDGTKASVEYWRKEIKHYHQELNNTAISCDECSYEGEFSSIESHSHIVPSQSPFWMEPSLNRTPQLQNIQNTDQVVDEIIENFKGSYIYKNYEYFFKKLGLNHSDIARVKHESGCEEGHALIKYLLIECFKIRSCRNDLPSITESFLKKSLNDAGFFATSNKFYCPSLQY